MSEPFDLDTIDMFPELPRDPVREYGGPVDPIVRALRQYASERHRSDLERRVLEAAAAELERVDREAP